MFQQEDEFTLPLLKKLPNWVEDLLPLINFQKDFSSASMAVHNSVTPVSLSSFNSFRTIFLYSLRFSTQSSPSSSESFFLLATDSNHFGLHRLLKSKYFRMFLHFCTSALLIRFRPSKNLNFGHVKNKTK